MHRPLIDIWSQLVLLTLSKQDAPLPPPTTKGQEEGSMEAPRPSLPRNYSHLTSIHMLRSGALGQYGGTPPSMDTTVCGATIPVPLPPQFSYNAYVPQSCQKGRISDVSSNSIVSCSAYCLQSIIGLAYDVPLVSSPPHGHYSLRIHHPGPFSSSIFEHMRSPELSQC